MDEQSRSRHRRGWNRPVRAPRARYWDGAAGPARRRRGRPGRRPKSASPSPMPALAGARRAGRRREPGTRSRAAATPDAAGHADPAGIDARPGTSAERLAPVPVGGHVALDRGSRRRRWSAVDACVVGRPSATATSPAIEAAPGARRRRPGTGWSRPTSYQFAVPQAVDAPRRSMPRSMDGVEPATAGTRRPRRSPWPTDPGDRGDTVNVVPYEASRRPTAKRVLAEFEADFRDGRRRHADRRAAASTGPRSTASRPDGSRPRSSAATGRPR